MNNKLTVYIERWSAANGRVSYPWSVWESGQRLDMGEARETAEAAEAAARAYCLSERGRAPDKVVRL